MIAYTNGIPSPRKVARDLAAKQAVLLVATGQPIDRHLSEAVEAERRDHRAAAS